MRYTSRLEFIFMRSLYLSAYLCFLPCRYIFPPRFPPTWFVLSRPTIFHLLLKKPQKFINRSNGFSLPRLIDDEKGKACIMEKRSLFSAECVLISLCSINYFAQESFFRIEGEFDVLLQRNMDRFVPRSTEGSRIMGALDEEWLKLFKGSAAFFPYLPEKIDRNETAVIIVFGAVKALTSQKFHQDARTDILLYCEDSLMFHSEINSINFFGFW